MSIFAAPNVLDIPTDTYDAYFFRKYKIRNQASSNHNHSLMSESFSSKVLDSSKIGSTDSRLSLSMTHIVLWLFVVVYCLLVFRYVLLPNILNSFHVLVIKKPII